MMLPLSLSQLPCYQQYNPNAFTATTTILSVLPTVPLTIVNFNMSATNVTANGTYASMIVNWVVFQLYWCYQIITPNNFCTSLWYGITVSSSCALYAIGSTIDQGSPNQNFGYMMATYDYANPVCFNQQFPQISVAITGVWTTPSTQQIVYVDDTNVTLANPINATSGGKCEDCTIDSFQCRDTNGVDPITRPVNAQFFVPEYLFYTLCFSQELGEYIWKLENLENTFGVFGQTYFYVDNVLVSAYSKMMPGFYFVYVPSLTPAASQQVFLNFSGTYDVPNDFSVTYDVPVCVCSINVLCSNPLDGSTIVFSPIIRNYTGVITGPQNIPPIAVTNPDILEDLNENPFLLDGSYSSDPDLFPGFNGTPGEVAYFWSCVGYCVIFGGFSNPNSAMTYINITGIGTVIIMLTVFDGQSYGSDSLTVTTFNLAPVVDLPATAGTFLVGELLNLTGSPYTYDPDDSPDPLQTLWVLLSGPTIPGGIMPNASAIDATFIPEAPGNYNFRLCAFDGLYTTCGGQVFYVANTAAPTSPPTPSPTTAPPTAIPTPSPTSAAPTLPPPPSVPSVAPTTTGPPMAPTPPVAPTASPTNHTPPTLFPPNLVPPESPASLIIMIVLIIVIPVSICIVLICASSARKPIYTDKSTSNRNGNSYQKIQGRPKSTGHRRYLKK